MLAAAFARSRSPNTGTAPRYALTAPCSSSAANRSTSACDFSFSTGKLYFALAATGLPPSFSTVLARASACSLWWPWNVSATRPPAFEQAAFGADLVRGDRFLFGAERGVQDPRVALAVARLAGGQRTLAPAEQRHGAGRRVMPVVSKARRRDNSSDDKS